MDTPIFDQVRYLMNYCECSEWECSLYYGLCDRDHFSLSSLTDY